MPAPPKSESENVYAVVGADVRVRATSRPSSQGDGPPSQYPCRPLDDTLLQLKKALAVAPPAALLDDLPQLPRAVRELVLDRIEAAMFERRIAIDCEMYAAVLMALMPAEFDIPDPPDRGKAGPTGTAPKTTDRELIYAARARRAVALFHAGDRNGQDERDALAVAWGDGRAPRVKEWRREGATGRNRGRSGTVPGAKPGKKAR